VISYFKQAENGLKPIRLHPPSLSIATVEQAEAHSPFIHLFSALAQLNRLKLIRPSSTLSEHCQS